MKTLLKNLYIANPQRRPVAAVAAGAKNLINTFNGFCILCYVCVKCLRSLSYQYNRNKCLLFLFISGNSFTSKWRNMLVKLYPKASKVTRNCMSLRTLSYIEWSMYTTTETTTLRWVLKKDCWVFFLLSKKCKYIFSKMGRKITICVMMSY